MYTSQATTTRCFTGRYSVLKMYERGRGGNQFFKRHMCEHFCWVVKSTAHKRKNSKTCSPLIERLGHEKIFLQISHFFSNLALAERY